MKSVRRKQRNIKISEIHIGRKLPSQPINHEGLESSFVGINKIITRTITRTTSITGNIVEITRSAANITRTDYMQM